MKNLLFEDINFLISNDDEVKLNRTSVKDLANLKIAFYANLEVYKNLLKKNKFEECLKLWQETNVKYLVLSNDELEELIKNIYEYKLYTLNLNWLDTLNITDMSHLFEDLTKFNGNITDWNTSNVENMALMFCNAISFNLPIGSWDVSNVKNMNVMFYHATSFNLPIGNWDVSNVKSMQGLFFHARTFNLPIGNWDVSNVKNINYMFNEAISFNLSIKDWNISNVKEAYNVFYKCPIKDEYKPRYK